MVVGDANDRTQCEEPVVLKYIAGQLYANLPTWETSFIAGGWTGVQRSCSCSSVDACAAVRCYGCGRRLAVAGGGLACSL